MTRLLVTTTFAAFLTTTPVLADLTVDDAWNTWKAQFTALGLRFEASETRDGEALQIGELRLNADFPLGFGTVYVHVPGPRFEPMDGGRVAVTMAPTGLMSMGGDITGEGSFAMAFEVQDNNSRGVMSGTTTAVISDWTSDGFSAALVDLAVSGEQAVDISGNLTMGPLTAHHETTLADGMLGLTAVTEMSGYDLQYTASLPDRDLGQMEVAATGMAGKTTSRSQFSLPETGIDILGLHKQLRNDLDLSIRTITDVTSSTQSVKVDGELVSDQKTSATDYDVFVKLGRFGLDYGGRVGGFNADLIMPELPFPISFGGGAADFRLLIPLLMGEDQDAALHMGFNDITLNDGLWAMFDPEQQLPRDPMTVVLDAASKASILFEFLDLRALLDGAQPPALPVMAKTATLNDLRLAGAGAEVTGKGDFTFDYSDLTTFDGMPAPEGRASFTINGAHGLIDKLIAMGLMEQSDAMGARLMMGLLTQPGDGDDVLTTTIEVKKTGEVLANGQRLQ
ncbi:hypothetical protein RXV86_10170 [Alisedimentitalea sp. MJ-SS2]|uniref:hypothetical protein n=1 Tax=Aliisedimentitalea sp. MJ-SS2 TaxID=3049795 RepID=UPI00290D5BC2|nr:hypothetical protein [Alisedimentitalea sp. MJ-SS2]MDU8927749.1 hypothetical protein [Alisedimentitalea sp. MJ-SS2]